MRRFTRLAKTNAPVRYGFLEREKKTDPLPPAVALLRGATGGRGITGGDVRLRLLLSMLWAVRDAPTLAYPYRAWAALLGLDSPETAGARRIRNALVWLDRHDLVTLDSSQGRDAIVHLKNEAGTGERYELPGSAYNRLRSKPAQAAQHRYIQLPGQLWTNGWINALDNGPALVMLLVIWLENGTAIKDTPAPFVWLSPAMAHDRYGLSEDTRLRGARKLSQLGLIKISTQHVPNNEFEFRRGRHAYQIQHDTIQNPPLGQLTTDGFFATPQSHPRALRSLAVPKPST